MNEGMQIVLGAVRGRSKASPWSSMVEADWEVGLDRFVRWLDSLVDQRADVSMEIVWIEVPSELNPATTAILGFPEFKRDLSEFGIPSQDSHWPVDDAIATPVHALVELEQVLVATGWRGAISAASEHEALGSSVLAVSHAYVVLLTLNGLPRSRVPALADPGKGLAVTIGWHDGDIEPVGVLRAGAWEKFPLPPNFRRVVLDANRPDMATRNLLQSRYIDAAAVRQRLREGANVHAVDRFGQTVLHIYGAADLDILTLLLDAGADVHAMYGGQSVIDGVLMKGGCKAAHLKLLLERGATFVRPCEHGGTPLHVLAEGGLHHRGRLAEVRSMMDMVLGLGYDMNAKDATGRDPLWRSLRAHAQELVEFIEYQRTEGIIGGTWDYQHDRVAMLLLERGADPNSRFVGEPSPLIPAGATPLMIRRYDDTTLVKALLKAGADPTLVSDAGKTALDYARDAAQAKPNPLCGIDPSRAAEVAAILERAIWARERGLTR